MKKKITLFIYMLFVSASITLAQTASLAPATTASPGENISMSLSVGSFTNIGAISFKISYNSDMLTYTGITQSGSVPGTILQGATGGLISLSWTANPPTFLTLTGEFCKLNFVYNGGTCGVNFIPSQCQVTTGTLTTVTVAYTNGGVSPFLNNTHKATLMNMTAMTGSVVSVPIKYEGFSSGNAGAITQHISYDPSSLSYTGISTLGTLSGATASISSYGIISVTWTNTSGAVIDYPANVINLNFVYTGSTATNLDFYPGSLIASNTLANIPVTYFSGVISPGTAQGTAILGSFTGAVQGQFYNVPLDFNFPIGISSFTVNITYDPSLLGFVGAIDLAQATSTLVSDTYGTITITYSNVGSPSINGTFLKLRFQYIGVNPAAVRFAAGCSFTNSTLQNVQVAYTDASINPGTPSASVTIGSMPAASVVNVPITFAGLPTNMGAVTINLIFDDTQLTYTGNVIGNTFGATVGPAFGNQISIAWNGASATNINGPLPFLQLQFNYSGSTPAEINFLATCELRDFGLNLVTATWNNGGVNMLYKISGTLKYNSDPNTRIPLNGFTVYLKTVPGNIVVGSAVTNATGYYEIMAVNGTYKLDAAPSLTAFAYADLQDVVALFNWTMGTPLPYEIPLRVAAGDVAAPLDGYPDLQDVLAIFAWTNSGVKPVEYIAPAWIFQTPAVIVNNAPQTIDFLGLSTGNVLGTNPTP
ncbi:MAG: cohesin domain-containing protein [Bacteroidota bacterium]